MQVRAARFLYPFRSRLGPTLTASIRRELNPEDCWHLVPELSLDAFAGELHKRGIAAVSLPLHDGKAEVELLIADADVGRIDDLVTKWPAGTPVGLYTVTGARRDCAFAPPQFDPNGRYSVSLLPPQIAEALLARARTRAGELKALEPTDALLVCAYRTAYLHAECWERSESGWLLSKSCEAKLLGLAETAQVQLSRPVTPASLDRLLESHGWRPSIDLLERAAHWMPWIKDVLPRSEADDLPGLSLFFIRQRAVEAGLEPMILDVIRDSGFEPLLVTALDDGQQRKAGEEFRGGNWGQGPYRVSGGPPASICVALDLLPLALDDRHRLTFPDADNRRIAVAKIAARDAVNAKLPKAEHYNAVHSTDNARQAWRAVRALIPELEATVREKSEELRRAFATDGAIRDLTKYGRRAKVELIEFDGRLAIRKTFRPSALRYMEREAKVMERLAPLCPEFPRLLLQGPNFIIMEYVGGGASPLPVWHKGRPVRPLPLRHVRRLAQLIKTILEQGFDPVDLRCDGNVIYTRGELKLIDFEFWRDCDPGTRPENSMCLSGIGCEDSGDRPNTARRNKDPYRIGWYPYTLLPLDSFLHDPPSVQRVKRAANRARAYGAWVPKTAFDLMKRGVKGIVRRVLKAALSLVSPRPGPRPRQERRAEDDA